MLIFAKIQDKAMETKKVQQIAEKIVEFQKICHEFDVKLLAVSKTFSAEEIFVAYQLDQRDFAENRVQELLPKYETLPKDIRWHLIGHLQSNKVKFIAPFVAMIHSVDSLSLLQEINKQAAKNDRVIPCLLQMHIAQEETKFGFDEYELNELLASGEVAKLKNIEIKGLMGMATFTPDLAVIHTEFAFIKRLFEVCKTTYSGENCHFEELSIGMSSDFPIAIHHGSTMIRVGSAIFGGR